MSLALPAVLHDELARRQLRLREALSREPAFLQEPDKAAAFGRVLACSRFVADALVANPGLLDELGADPWRPYADGEMAARLTARLATATDEAALLKALRTFRRREMVRIVWRDLARLTDLEGTVRDMTALADACIAQALDWWHPRLVAELGEPVSAEGRPQHLVVLAMGKLGAGELNVSSDIDLIFAYPDNGETRGKPRSLDNHEFFTRLGRKLIHALDAITADGQVFRVDMRLRPWGQSGALALSFDAMEEYYQNQGREWERYAMIKARAVTGDPQDSVRLLALLRPFTYRRYIDFSAIEALREMKGMIAREVRRKGMDGNLKLGPGGIREVEFIVQSFQLIRGGQEPALRERYLLSVLHWLGGHGYLPEAAVAELDAAYRFLRNAEHAIQGLEDRQTQMLPEAPAAQAAVALAMGFAGWDAFRTALDGHRAAVQRHFRAVVSDDGEAAGDDGNLAEWGALWRGELPLEQALLRLQAWQDPQAALSRLAGLRDAAAVRMMQSLGRERLDHFMPVLLAMLDGQPAPDDTLQRLLPLVEAVARRTAYLVLLLENRAALTQLVSLCAASPWIAAQLARHPALLDELLDPRTLYSLPDRAALGRLLGEHMLRVPEDDLEQQMDQLRYFRLAHGLRIAACEASGALPLMKVSDQLTWLAEALLCYALELAGHDLVRHHGRPGGVPAGDPLPFIVVGYGKLGGIELGHGSDLDLVFLYDAPMDAGTDGPRPLDNASFFTRLGQRLIHLLTAQTPLGKLYEVDMRLRPSGASGLLVSSLDAFAHYQQQDAWTWEHQALTRARVVAGSPALAGRFNAVRDSVLRRERDLDRLRQDVVAMRRKMRDQLLDAAGRAGQGPFPLKQGRGGIVDIEFMVQYAVLAWSCRYPSLVRYTDNVRILECLAAEGLLDAAAAERLRAAWIDYRMALHRLALQQQPGKVPADAFAAHRAAVLAQWQDWLGEGA